MELQGPGPSGTSDATLATKSLQLAKQQQEQEGQATLQLLESAAGVPTATSDDPSKGSIINTYA
ncbi:hypothetical protein [Aestuariibacter salexigens]|uniref:hypothetical protein n=1 Tax=Aestuariibacter salexigens TaxID=226010 RepID=UPI00041F030F|nr:hypothetical protein [Aestuariibacter salexigens]